MNSSIPPAKPLAALSMARHRIIGISKSILPPSWNLIVSDCLRALEDARFVTLRGILLIKKLCLEAVNFSRPRITKAAIQAEQDLLSLSRNTRAINSAATVPKVFIYRKNLPRLKSAKADLQHNSSSRVSHTLETLHLERKIF
jgi:hypothetical protein